MSRRPVDNPRVNRTRDADNKHAHSVYRIYDADDRLMYVGVAQDVQGRIYMHTTAWYSNPTSMAMAGCMATYTEVRYPTKLDARAAERAAIASEVPLFNKQHNPKRWARRAGGYECLIPFAEPRKIGDFFTRPLLRQDVAA